MRDCLFSRLTYYDFKYGWLYDNSPEQLGVEWVRSRMDGIIAPQRQDVTSSTFKNEGIVHDYGNGDPEVVVLGDSHSLMWSRTIDEICRDLRTTVSFFGMDGGASPLLNLREGDQGTGILTPPQRAEFDRARILNLQKWKPPVVIIAARWDQYPEKQAEFEEMLAFLKTLGSQVILIEQPPVLPFGDRNALHMAALMKWHRAESVTARKSLPMANFAQWKRGKVMLASLADRFDFCTLVSLTDDLVDRDQRTLFQRGGEVLYIDDDHFSEAGCALFQTRLSDAIEGCIKGGAGELSLK
ncbi:MAG: SGNH/GDSL hydrolase family protein [Verrucomicrobiaceae bacterium]|nr:MAG: SGNH/GDSL hydrolase family protein [Verrucomicrobiaceae bacterium]